MRKEEQKIWFVGDIHGKVKEFNDLLERRILPESEPNEPIIQLGDMGMGFVFIPKYHDNVRWIRGNHDDPTLSRLHPNYMGNTLGIGRDFGYDAGHKLFWLAGAWSIDKDMRVLHELRGGKKTWWEDEELSQEQLDAAFELYVENKPEIMVSHEAPVSIVPKVLWVSTSASVKKGEPMYDEGIVTLREETGYYQRKEKLGCIETRTSKALQKMFEHHNPRFWAFGHYHISKTIDAGSTLFKCCAELEPYRILQ